MRVIGDERLATRAMRAIDDPVVGGVDRAEHIRGRRGRQCRIELVERQPAIDWAQFGQGCRRSFGVFGIKKGEIVGRYRSGKPRPFQLIAVVEPQLQVHQLAPDEAVRRSP